LKCNFELDLCGLQNDLSGEFNWTRTYGKFGYGTGPTVDHSVIKLKIFFFNILRNNFLIITKTKTSSPSGYYMVINKLFNF